VELKSPGYKMVEIVWTSASWVSQLATAATSLPPENGGVRIGGRWLFGPLQIELFALGWGGGFWFNRRVHLA